MSRDDSTSITAPIKVLNLPDSFCYEDMPQFVKALSQYLVAVIPTSVTNVVVSNVQPNDTQRFTVWFRLNNAGTFVGIYIFSNGTWVPLYPPETKTWEPVYSTSDPAMSFVDVTTLNATYFEIGDFIWVSGQAKGETLGTAQNGIRASLPVDAFNINQPLSGSVWNGGQLLGGIAELVDVSTVECRKYDGSNFGIGNDRGISFSGMYQKAL